MRLGGHSGFVQPRKNRSRQLVDTSLLGSIMSVIGIQIDMPAMLNGAEFPKGTREAAANAISNHYKCKDGKWIAMAHMDPEDKFWGPVCEAVGLPDEIRDAPEFQGMHNKALNAEKLVKIMDEYMAKRDRDEWIEIMSQKGLIVAPVQTPAEVVHDAQALANNYMIDYEHPTAGTLREIGFPWDFSETPAGINVLPLRWVNIQMRS